ncbi:unnamed protein product [Orchesella dallaii]|uniref:Translation initiation factor eIF2B subunit gamma n=1 Tax=Orchesella dallaii TaxID=48710 RepID=A0ABP1RBW1_9HEXA
MVYESKVQAVVLAAGRGSRMTQLLGTTVPKCLVPVCGNPLVYYPLKSLEAVGFRGKDILVIIQDRDDVRRALLSIADRLGLSGLDILTVPEDSEDFGTAESIRIALSSKKITRDALLISCDTIADIPFRELFDFHEIKESELTTLFVSPLQIPENVKLPGPKSKIKQERDIVGVKPGTNNLVYMASEADCEEEVKLPVSTLKSCPHTKILTGLVDTHVYLIKNSLLNRLLAATSERNFISFKGEFMPFLIQNHFLPDFSEYTFKFYACIEPKYRCVRVNSIPSFALANKSGDWIKDVFLNGVIPKSKCKIARGSKLWGTTLGEQCVVEEKAKLTNVIAMDGVVIKAGATVEGCILSSHSIIGANSVLKECLVGPKYQIPAEGRFTNEQLSVMEEAYFGD